MQVCSDPLKILGVKDLKIEEVPVPEWDMIVLVKNISGVEGDRFEASLIGDNKLTLENSTAYLCSLALCDWSGKRLFNDNQIVDLGAKSAAALDRVYDVARRLSRIGKQAAEDTEKNSAPTPGGSSSSSSPPAGDAPSANCSSAPTTTS